MPWGLPMGDPATDQNALRGTGDSQARWPSQMPVALPKLADGGDRLTGAPLSATQGNEAGVPCPWGVMVIVSPCATSSRRRENCVFASYTQTCFMAHLGSGPYRSRALGEVKGMARPAAAACGIIQTVLDHSEA